MDSFIDREVGETRLDSHGKFTLNSRQAIAKMARFQLPDKNYWMLKLVQAAVRSGAGDLSISLGVDSSRILFLPAEEWVQVESDLLDPQPSPTPARYHFKQALWSAAFDQGIAFDLRLPGAAQELLFRDGQFEHRDCRPGKQLRLLMHHRPAAEMSQLLFQQAYVAPIPVYLNQERVDDMASRDVCLFYETLEWPEFPLKVRSENCRSHFQFTREPVERESGLPLLISRSLHPSRRHWVLDGILLQSQPLHIPGNALRCDLYLSAAGLDCDATGTQLVENEAWQDRRREAGRRMAACIQKLDLVDTTPKRTDLGGASRVVGGIFAATFLLNPVLVSGFALMAMGVIKAATLATPPQPPAELAQLAALKDLIRNFRG